MTKRNATAMQQPDLLGGAPPAKPTKTKTPKAAALPPKKTELAVVQGGAPKTLIERLREVSNGSDVAVAKEILAMIRSEEDRNAARAFDESMLACQGELPPITRDTYNNHTKSKWAKLEKISRIVDPIIRKHGFTLSYGMATSPLPDHYRIVCDVAHRGFARRYEVDVGMDSKGPKGEGNKSLAQGSGSSVTYARRYLKVMIFDIVIEGEDNDGNVRSLRSKVIEGESIEGCSEDQLMKVREAIEGCGVSDKNFCAHFKITKVSQLAAADYQNALAACKSYAEKAK